MLQQKRIDEPGINKKPKQNNNYGTQKHVLPPSEVKGQKSEIRNFSGSLIMAPSILPISAQSVVTSRCCCTVIYEQSFAKSKEVSVSLFSPSQSVSLLIK